MSTQKGVNSIQRNRHRYISKLSRSGLPQNASSLDYATRHSSAVIKAATQFDDFPELRDQSTSHILQSADADAPITSFLPIRFQKIKHDDKLKEKQLECECNCKWVKGGEDAELLRLWGGDDDGSNSEENDSPIASFPSFTHHSHSCRPKRPHPPFDELDEPQFVPPNLGVAQHSLTQSAASPSHHVMFTSSPRHTLSRVVDAPIIRALPRRPPHHHDQLHSVTKQHQNDRQRDDVIPLSAILRNTCRASPLPLQNDENKEWTQLNEVNSQSESKEKMEKQSKNPPDWLLLERSDPDGEEIFATKRSPNK